MGVAEWAPSPVLAAKRVGGGAAARVRVSPWMRVGDLFRVWAPRDEQLSSRKAEASLT